MRQAFRQVGYGEVFSFSLWVAELAPARRRGARSSRSEQLLRLGQRILGEKAHETLPRPVF